MAVDHDGRACLRETARNGCANVLSRSCNDRDASVEVCLVHGRHQRAPLLGLDILRYSMRGTQDQTTNRIKLRRILSEDMVSALPSNSDIARRGRHVSNVPTADLPPVDNRGWTS